MSAFAALTLYPIWAVAFAIGLTAMRLGRRVGRGLVVLCLCLGTWVTGLILLETPAYAQYAERVLPLGMLLAGAFLHAGAEVAGVPARRLVRGAYAFAGAVSALGLLVPRLLYGPAARTPGPLFLPLAVLSSVGSGACILWLARAAWRAPPGLERRRRWAVAVGCLTGALGGGGVIGLRVWGLYGVQVSAPLLLVSVVLAAYAVLTSEDGPGRGLVVQGLVQTVVTAGLSAVGLVAFYRVLPDLAPGGGAELPWLVVVVFLAALPLEPLRLLLVEGAGRRIFRRSIAVADLARRVEVEETRAEHAERLAAIGRVAGAVAHEIRNPLGVIAAQAMLLERKGADPGGVSAIRAQIDRARHFVDDLLRYGKPRPLDLREIEVGPVVELAASNVRAAWKGETPPDITVEGARGLRVEADRGALGDVVTVLVENAAIAASSTPGARVRVSVAEGEDGVVLVRVEDDGPGVPEALLSGLFEPFVTGRGRDAVHPGTGLGLAIARRWVERHGGTLRHERPEGGGARFVAAWPRRAAILRGDEDP